MRLLLPGLLLGTTAMALMLEMLQALLLTRARAAAAPGCRVHGIGSMTILRVIWGCLGAGCLVLVLVLPLCGPTAHSQQIMKRPTCITAAQT